MPSMTARVEIETANKDSALAVPLSAFKKLIKMEHM